MVTNNLSDKQQTATIMVVDDDENWCFISKSLLRKAGVGDNVITASNGLLALQKLHALADTGDKLPELILLDIKMPVMDGFGLLDELSKSTALDLNQTKIYICTSSFHPKDKEKAELYPIAGFITKPLTLAIIKSII